MAKKHKAKTKRPVSLEAHIRAVEKRLDRLRQLILRNQKTVADNQAREAAMVEELAALVAQLPVVVAAAVEPAPAA